MKLDKPACAQLLVLIQAVSSKQQGVAFRAHMVEDKLDQQEREQALLLLQKADFAYLNQNGAEMKDLIEEVFRLLDERPRQLV